MRMKEGRGRNAVAAVAEETLVDLYALERTAPSGDGAEEQARPRVILFANTDWNLYMYRLPLARYIRAAGYEVVMVAPPGRFVEGVREAGFRFVPVEMSRKGLNPFAELHTLARLVRLFRREKPDIVHSFTAKGVLFGSLAARLAGVKQIVNSITGLGYVFSSADLQARLLRPLVERWYRMVLRDSQVIFQNSDDQHYFVEQAFISGTDGHLILGSGVDTELLQPVPEPDIESDTGPDAGLDTGPLVLLAGRMLWDKGIDAFVEAARLLRQEGVRARFALVGDSDEGNPAAVPRPQLEAWQAEGVVEWWGFRDDIDKVLAQGHVVCLPSFREGVPRVLLEAGALGRPLITTDTPGCREVVQHGENGLLVPVRDAAALAAAIRRLLADKALRQQMGLRARATVEARFSIDRVAQDTLRIYGLASRASRNGRLVEVGPVP